MWIRMLHKEFGAVACLGAILIGTTGCATFGGGSHKVDYKKRNQRLAAELKKKNTQLENLREKNHVLSSKVKRGPTVKVESRSPITLASPEGNEVWQIPTGAFNHDLDTQKEMVSSPRSGMSIGSGSGERSEPTDQQSAIGSPGAALVGQPAAQVASADRPQHFSPGVSAAAIPRRLPAKKIPQLTIRDIDDGPAVPFAQAPFSQGVPAPAVADSAKLASSSNPSLAPSETNEKAEHILYAKVMETYRRHQADEMQKAVRLFLKTYPHSVYADNALLLSALLSLSQKQFQIARRDLDSVLRNYPEGNKVVSAMFTKAVLFRDSQRWSDARRLLRKIQKLYPGSPEAQRVPFETKWIASLEKTGGHR